MKNILVPLIFLLLACGNERKIMFQAMDFHCIDSCIQNNNITVFCYIDSADCTVCSMQWLNLWLHYLNELKKYDTGIALIVNNTDEYVVKNYLTHLQLDFPVVFDKSSMIKQKNAIVLNHHSIFAVNENKEVVWLGSPIKNEDTWNLFIKMLQRHSKTI